MVLEQEIEEQDSIEKRLDNIEKDLCNLKKKMQTDMKDKLRKYKLSVSSPQDIAKLSYIIEEEKLGNI